MGPKTVKVFNQGSSVVMVIPAAFADELAIGAGDFLLISLQKKQLMVRKIAYKDFRKKE